MRWTSSKKDLGSGVVALTSAATSVRNGMFRLVTMFDGEWSFVFSSDLFFLAVPLICHSVQFVSQHLICFREFLHTGG